MKIIDKFLYNLACIECKSSTGIGVYERLTGEKYGYCFSCNKIIKSELLDISYSDFRISNKYNLGKDNMNKIEDSSLNALKSRGISKEACIKYGVTSIFEDGSDTFHFYPNTKDDKIIGYMKRDVKNKDFRLYGEKDNLQFFGQNIAGANGKMIIVTEGQLDSLACYDMLSTMGKNYRVISINNGASSSVKCFKDNYEWISSFDNIFLAFDQDKSGKKASELISNMFPPNKIKNLTFSEKDPNDLLVNNKSREFLNSIFSARDGRSSGIVSVDDIFEEAIKEPKEGKSFPWSSLTDVTYGYRAGEIYGIGAGSGCGKTEAFKEMINHTIYHHEEKAGVIFLEETVYKTIRVLAGKHLNKRFHIPTDKGGNWTIDELVDGISDLKGKVYLYNHFGSKDWSTIAAKIRYMSTCLGIKDIYLDHLTALVAQEDNEYKALNKIMEEMASLVQELDCTIFYISHLRKSVGKSHEEGGRVSADQFKGSGAIVYWSNFLFGIERNQQAEDTEERNISTFRVLKDRNTGLATGTNFKLKYSHETGRWEEYDEEKYNEEDFDEII